MRKILLLLLIVSFSKNYAQTDYAFVYNNDSILKKGADYHNNKKYDEALLEYKKITKTDPKYLSAQYEIGLTLNAQEKKAEFIELMEGLYTQGKMPDFPELYQMYAVFLSNEKEYEKSEKIFKEGEKYLSNSSLFQYNFAILYVRKKEIQKSVDIVEQIITNNPNYPSAHYLLGTLAFENGKITEGTLAFMTYLILAPTGSYANQAILGLNANYGENYLTENTVVFSKSGDNFEEIDVILRNQLPLKKVYKIKSSIDDRITRQMQAVAEYAVEHKVGDGFFENSYIPWIKDLVTKNYFEGYTYYSLLSMEDKLGKDLTKQKKKIIAFRDDYLLKDFWNIFGIRKQDLFGKMENVMVSIRQERPFIVGVQVNGQFEGKCKYLNNYGNLAGELNFKNGELDGLQKYYDEKGRLNEEKYFANGKLNGTRTTYYENGNVEMVENYSEDMLDGIATTYYPNGGKNCELNYIKNERHGTIVCLYQNGSILSESEYKDGKFSGKYNHYNQIGDLIETYSGDNNKIEGVYFEYYDGKTIKGEGFYKDGLPDGAYKSFYPNKSLRRESTYISGKIIKSVDYFENGKKSHETLYNDKEEMESFSYFDKDGNKYFEEKYKSGQLKTAYQFSQNNQKATEVNLAKKTFEIKNFDTSLRVKGTFEKGKKTGEWNYYYDSGRLRLNEFYTQGKTVGLSKDYNLNGKLTAISNYKNDTLSGRYEKYNGTKLSQLFNYEKGTPNGPFTLFYSDGNKSVEGYLVANKVNYDKYTYGQNGTISVIDHYIYDAISFRKTFSVKGKLENEIDYKNKTGKFTYSYNNGTYTKMYELKNGVLNGKFIEKDKLKVPVIDGEYVNNELNNTYKTYSPVGTLLSDSNYYSGKLNGIRTDYDFVGNIRTTQEYAFGVENGATTRYYHNKSKLLQYNQQNESIEGEKIYYNQKGESLLIIGYENNIPLYFIKKNATGELAEKINIENQTATIVSLYPNGKTAIQLNLNKGSNDSDFIINNNEGKPEFKCTYDNNSLEGERVEYYSNGKVYKKERFTNNEYNGLQEYFKEDGKLWAVLSYKNDELHGNTLLYNGGKLVQTKKYDSDELVEIIK